MIGGDPSSGVVQYSNGSNMSNCLIVHKLSSIGLGFLCPELRPFPCYLPKITLQHCKESSLVKTWLDMDMEQG